MEFARVGYFIKAHGVKGHLIIKPEAEFDVENVNAVFVDTAVGKAPYFITEISETEKGYMVLLEGAASIDKARSLIGKQVYLDAKFIIERETPEWIAYEVIDKNFGVIGTIEEINDNGAQLLASINYKGKEIILPMVDEFIERIDEENRKIYFNAPEGLIDVYLNV